MSFNISTFQETNVTVASANAVSSVGQTFLAVMLVLLGIRPALTIASIVPFAVMFAPLVMVYVRIDIQQVSIAAVIMSLGLLVDNGLVVVEEIQTKVDNCMSPYDATCLPFVCSRNGLRRWRALLFFDKIKAMPPQWGAWPLTLERLVIGCTTIRGISL